jgi:hypothetical protein
MDSLFPAIESSAAWLEDLPITLGGWSRIESGMESIFQDLSQADQLQANEGGPRLSEIERRIVDIIRRANRRLTTNEILTKLGASVSVGMTKQTLANLVRNRSLDNRADVRPRGYGLGPELPR